MQSEGPCKEASYARIKSQQEQKGQNVRKANMHINGTLQISNNRLHGGMTAIEVPKAIHASRGRD